ncbi:MAG TPA: serine hydrolase domain-containing protein [Thermomicrobiales bacterium]|jgi:CubicO group peptidase (beta-lactamase class C family)|nr:serine hydrolase domain-containing protein [Thermomicrobiales bacterium]
MVSSISTVTSKVRLPRRDVLRLSAAATSIVALDRIALPNEVRAIAPDRSIFSRQATPAAGDPVEVRLADDASAAFTAVAESLGGAMTQMGVPGATLGILSGGTVEVATLGVASLESGSAVADDTLFQIGSLTKTMTATAAMRLVDAGLLDIDEPVRSYLPEFRVADESVSERVTVRHLLTHTGGWWGDYFVETGEDDADGLALVRDIFPELPQLSPLGALFSYNNAGFCLLGSVIATVHGTSYRQAMDDLVFGPLGMTATTFDRAVVEAGAYSEGYADPGSGNELQSPLYFPRNVDPAGGAWSTAADILRYARFHMGDGTAGGDGEGETLLSPYALRFMRQPQVNISSQPGMSVGMSWLLTGAGTTPLALHPGDTFGQHAEFWMAPEAGFAFVVLINAAPGGALASAQSFAAAAEAYDELADLRESGSVSLVGGEDEGTPEAGATPAMPAIDPSEYVGRYAVPNSALTFQPDGDGLTLLFEITPLPDEVVATVSPPTEPEVAAEFVGPDLIQATIQGLPLTLSFVRRPDGTVRYVDVGFRLSPRVED